MKTLPLPPLEILVAAFSLDAKRGVLVRKAKPRDAFASDRMFRSWNSQWAGKDAGYVTDRGYVLLSFIGKQYWAHRIIYAIYYGISPDGYDVDHIDLNKSNNRPENLRLATRSQNSFNQTSRSMSKSGIKGVYVAGGRYKAQITRNGIVYSLGSFSTAEEARSAYAAASSELHGEFGRTDG